MSSRTSLIAFSFLSGILGAGYLLRAEFIHQQVLLEAHELAEIITFFKYGPMHPWVVVMLIAGMITGVIASRKSPRSVALAGAFLCFLVLALNALF